MRTVKEYSEEMTNKAELMFATRFKVPDPSGVDVECPVCGEELLNRPGTTISQMGPQGIVLGVQCVKCNKKGYIDIDCFGTGSGELIWGDEE